MLKKLLKILEYLIKILIITIADNAKELIFWFACLNFNIWILGWTELNIAPELRYPVSIPIVYFTTFTFFSVPFIFIFLYSYNIFLWLNFRKELTSI